jgi:nitrous oxidase accessory protein NosD
MTELAHQQRKPTLAFPPRSNSPLGQTQYPPSLATPPGPFTALPPPPTEEPDLPPPPVEAAAPRNSNTWAVALTLLVVFTLGGGGVYYYLHQNGGATTGDGNSNNQTPHASDKELVVGPGHLATIAEALAKARTDQVDTIHILPGTYTESLRLDKRVRLVGDGARESIIIQGGNGPALRVESDGVRINGLTLRAGTGPATADCPATVCVVRGDVEIINCDIAWEGTGTDRAKGGACVEAVGNAARASLSQCKLHNGRFGLLVRQGAEPSLRKCELEDNHIGVHAEDGCRGSLADCLLKNNSGVGVYLGKGADLRLEKDCRILGGTDGVVFDTGARGQMDNCRVEGQDNDGVWVKEGAEPELRHCHILKAMNGVHVSGGKATLEDCSLAENRNNGLLIRGGKAVLIHCRLDRNHTHGAYVLGPGDAELHHCSLSNNETGSGAKVESGGVARLLDCTSQNNKLWALEARGAGTAVDARGCARAQLQPNGKEPLGRDPEAEVKEPGE